MKILLIFKDKKLKKPNFLTGFIIFLDEKSKFLRTN